MFDKFLGTNSAKHKINFVKASSAAADPDPLRINLRFEGPPTAVGIRESRGVIQRLLS